MELDDEALTRASDPVRESLAALSTAYDCGWSDALHDSFETYVAQCRRAAALAEEETLRMRALCERISPIGAEKYRQRCEALRREIDDI